MTEKKMSFLKRFLIYQKERFPLVQNSMFLAAFSFSAISYSRICRGEEGFVQMKLFVSAAITTITLFFLLRIADEFKDREEDAKYRPHLPVPRGLISFKELKIMAIITLVIQIIINVILTPKMLIWLLIPQFFFLLMLKEFFISKWLKKNWSIYVLSHMFFFPAIDIYSSGMDWYMEGPGYAPFGMFFFFLVSYMNGIVWEIGRKIKTKEEEEHNSYTKLYGTRRAVWIWITSISVAYIFSLMAAYYVNFGWLGAFILSFIYLSSLVYGIIFLFHRTAKLSKLIEMASGSWGLFMYLTLGALPMLIQLLNN